MRIKHESLTILVMTHMRELAVDYNATGGDDRPTFKKSMNQLSDMGQRQFGKTATF
jgi:hypothetical protein